MRKILLILCLILLTTYIFCNDVIGIIANVEGELLLKTESKEKDLEKGDLIYKTSEIIYKNTKKGKIKLLTLTGFFDIGRFPAKDFNDYLTIDNQTQSDMLAAIGGTVVKSRNLNQVFEWQMELGNIVEEDIIKNDLKLVFSTKESSKELKDYMPIIIKINDEYKIKEVNYKIIDTENYSAPIEGNFIEKDNNFILDFNSTECKKDIIYKIICNINLSKNKTAKYKSNFQIIDNESIEILEEEISSTFTENDSDFVKKIKRASLYENYELNTRKNNLLVEIGAFE